MKIQRVYLDTSVLGGCFDTEFAQWSNGLIADFLRKALHPVVSTIVATELQSAPLPVQMVYKELIELGADVLDITDTLDLANAYQQRGILTPKFYADGLHIALATVAEVDIVVSWNFKHIVHFDKIRLFNAVNLEHGYKPIYIYSPREVTYYGAEGDQNS
ncbi:MAG TPA: hypothetical protein VGD69_09570 [Herpetosiphonaceae bacterium]